MLKLENVCAGYGAIEALRDVTIEVGKGEIITLIGANGAGKSTLLMTVCGDVKATSGKIFLRNEDITDKKTYQIMQKKIAISPEGRRIFPKLTVSENLRLGAYHADKELIDVELQNVLKMFPRLAERYHQIGGTLSGGEQHMLAIGRALMSKPELLLLDEPSLGLAPLIIAQIFEVLQEISQAGMTIFLVEQNANKALALADRGYVIESGRIVLSGTGRELADNPEVKKAYLGAA